MIEITLVEDKGIVGKLDGMSRQLHDALLRKVTELTHVIEGKVKADKLSGQVLTPRTGALRQSIQTSVEDQGETIVGSVFSSGVKYAAIHEYGGKIPAHEIVPSKANALAFFWQGQQRFFKRVQIPEITMPERSYLR